MRVQSNYCQSASATIAAAFHARSGKYRYLGQILEVPKDQYEACVQQMRDRIARGQIPGVADPEAAAALIKQGAVTYVQARNIARAGNVDSLVFDAKTQQVTAMDASAVSSVITYAQDRHGGTSSPDALRAAFRAALDSGSNTLIASLVSAQWLRPLVGIQLLRPKTAAIGAAAMRNGVRALWRTLNAEGGREVVQRIAVVFKANSIATSGAGAFRHVSRLLRSNAITAVVTTVVTSIPDFYRAAFVGCISWQQFAKNTTVNAAAVVGGIGGWMGGTALGVAAGNAVPFISTSVGSIIGGIAGGLAGGTGAQFATKALADKVVKDDSKDLIAAMEDEVQLLAIEYMLTESEVEQIAAEVGKTVNPKWLQSMYKETNKSADDHARRRFVRTEFEPKFAAIIQKRPKIMSPSVEESA